MSVLRAELLKVLTTRLLLWFALGLVAFVALVVSIHVGSTDRLSLATESTQKSVLQAAGLAAVAAALVGSILVTTEYSHGTINQSFLAVPVRARLLAAKLATALLVTAGLAIAAALATVVVAAIWFEGRGEVLQLDATTLTPLFGALAASALAGGIGLGVGTLLRRQTATTVLILVWLLVGENIIGLIPGAARYAPGHVLAGVVVAHEHSSASTLALWPAVLVALLYLVLFCAAGFVAVARSDVPSGGE